MWVWATAPGLIRQSSHNRANLRARKTSWLEDQLPQPARLRGSGGSVVNSVTLVDREVAEHEAALVRRIRLMAVF
jgi:hypothetical protein